MLVFDLTTGSCRCRLEGHIGRVNGVRFLEGSECAVTVSDDRTFKVRYSVLCLPSKSVCVGVRCIFWCIVENPCCVEKVRYRYIVLCPLPKVCVFGGEVRDVSWHIANKCGGLARRGSGLYCHCHTIEVSRYSQCDMVLN